MILPAIHCRRCKTLMDLVATIQPIGTHPGSHGDVQVKGVVLG